MGSKFNMRNSFCFKLDKKTAENGIFKHNFKKFNLEKFGKIDFMLVCKIRKGKRDILNNFCRLIT